jgi:hypothetical protein
VASQTKTPSRRYFSKNYNGKELEPVVKTLLRMAFYASSCYDRIIPSIASLASRSFGLHQTLCFIHATFFRQAKYKLKTKLGLSKEDYSHCHLHPIYGTGQGSTNSPVIWVLISSRLFDAHATRAHGANFVSPDGSYHLKVFIIGFVDDSYACVNDFTNPIQSPDLLLERATADAQLWNDLLSSSGGALEIAKCVYHQWFHRSWLSSPATLTSRQATASDSRSACFLIPLLSMLVTIRSSENPGMFQKSFI